MAVFIARKCACGGTLEYYPNDKVWICKYCGTVVEREATFDKIHVDGIEGICDVVRQTLMDIANQKMDSASKNLEDCERKEHKHIGTLLANLSFNLANISCAETQDEARGSLDKVRIFSTYLKENFPVIAEDEINLYEAFGDDAGDIFANLLVVFDTLGDSKRVDFVSSKLQPEKVFSPYANKTLLKVAIRRNKYDVVDKIINNIGHIDRKTSLQEIMEHYPSNNKKIQLIKALFNSETAAALGKKFFENYFASIDDLIEIKTEVVKLLNTTNIHINAEIVVKNAQNQLDSYNNAKCLFNALYDIKISDKETEALFVFCLKINKNYKVQSAFLDSLIEKNVFVALNAQVVISFLDSSQFAGDERAEILKKMLVFHLDSKALDTIYNYYLNNNKDNIETRKNIIDILLVSDAPISTQTVKNYVIKTQTDREDKLEIIKKIFATGINKTYIGDLLSDYMLYSKDSDELKSRIADYLMNQGFKAGSDVLSQYVTSSKDNIKVKVEKTRQLVQNGTQIKEDTLDSYILSIKQSDEFSEEMFNLLAAYNYSVSFAAYAKFLLYCKDIDKIRHNEKIVSAVNGDFNDRNVGINHNGNNISCNVFQAYVLNTMDSFDVAEAIVSQFKALKVRLNMDIILNGAIEKFKKYIKKNKASLSPLTLQLCEENKMFSLF